MKASPPAILPTAQCVLCGVYVVERDTYDIPGGCVCEMCVREKLQRLVSPNRRRYEYHKVEGGAVVASSKKAKQGMTTALDAALTEIRQGRV